MCDLLWRKWRWFLAIFWDLCAGYELTCVLCPAAFYVLLGRLRQAELWRLACQRSGSISFQRLPFLFCNAGWSVCLLMFSSGSYVSIEGLGGFHVIWVKSYIPFRIFNQWRLVNIGQWTQERWVLFSHLSHVIWILSGWPIYLELCRPNSYL